MLLRLARKVRLWRETFSAGLTNTGNITATVSGNLVLNWHGTPTQRDDALKTFPKVRDKLMPGLALASFADACIANIRDDGMSPDDTGANIQRAAMLWRVFTTRIPGDSSAATYGDIIGITNLHAAFTVAERSNDQFNVSWEISTQG
jgi:hypothetical protein